MTQNPSYSPDLLHRAFQQIDAVLDDPVRLKAVTDVLEVPVPKLVHEVTTSLAVSMSVPFVAATVLDHDQQHYLSTSHGAHVPLERDASKCQYVIASGHMVAINNVRSSSLWSRLGDLMIGPDKMAAYLGVPLKNFDGEILGALCAVDTKARTWTAPEHYKLFEASALIGKLLDAAVVTAAHLAQ